MCKEKDKIKEKKGRFLFGGTPFVYGTTVDGENTFISCSTDDSTYYPYTYDPNNPWIYPAQPNQYDDNWNYTYWYQYLCPYCGLSINSGYTYCPYCGKKLVDTRKQEIKELKDKIDEAHKVLMDILKRVQKLEEEE